MRLLLAVVLAALSSVAHAELQLSLVSKLDWDLSQPWFGGFSAFEMAPDGASAILITDRGKLITAQIKREQGHISGLNVTSVKTLLDTNGKPFKDRVHDAEGIAIGPHGTAFLSFEFDHRITSLNLKNAETRPLPNHPNFANFPVNKGLEALAVDPKGTLYAFSENATSDSVTTPLYRYADDRWDITQHVSLHPPFVPVGADIDDQSRLFLLERAVTPLGFRSRIRIFDLTTNPLISRTLLTTDPAEFDNLESISIWQDPSGRAHLTVISDDNFLPIQRSQIVEFILTE
ncbi:MAG: esterase-like activity of phytase family protein [Sulfitobacter sp.]